MFTGAITSLESRLDTILADEQELAAKQRATEQALTTARSGRSQAVSGKLDIPPGKSSNTGSREASRTRVNDRLAERLAKATAQKAGGSQVGSNVPSRVVSPAIGTDSASESGESKRSGEVARSVPAIEDTAATETDELKIPEPGVQDEVETHGHNTAKPETDGASTLLNSGLPINPAKISLDSSRPSVETNHDTTPDRISIELANGHTAPAKSATDLEAEMAQMRDDYAAAQKQRQVEMHANLERIDALQAKLQYLAKETVAAAKEAKDTKFDALSGEGIGPYPVGCARQAETAGTRLSNWLPLDVAGALAWMTAVLVSEGSSRIDERDASTADCE